MSEITLSGCTPEPLMSYLKALGVFRLVAEQKDPSAKLSWKNGTAVLHTTLDREGLMRFLLDEYKPTPIVGPWGARSGFFPGSSESSAREALNAIAEGAANALRLRPFAEMITGVRRVLTRLGFTEKAKDDDKLRLLRECRNELNDHLIPWLDTAYILTEEGRKFPPLLGTGGNEGSGSYVSTFAQTVVNLIVRGQSAGGVDTALFGMFESQLGGLAVGHFDPGALGGPNGTQGVSGGGGANPWDYLLGIEGSLLFAGAAARRYGADAVGKAAYPFCVEPVAVGYASESDVEAGEKTRAELWLPLWDTPTSLGEVSRLFAEGRAQLGRRQAKNAVEFALALSMLGVSRGLTSFVRYAFVMRYGLSYFAAPLGRVPVKIRPDARLLDEPPIAAWIDKLRLACREKDKTPARYQTALRNIDRAMFAFANRSQTDDSADAGYLLDVLRAVGRAERTLANGLRFSQEKYLRPLAGLSLDWLLQAKPGDAWRTFRLAASLASILAARGTDLGPIRVHLESVEVSGEWVKWSAGSTSAVWSAQPLIHNLSAVLLRRALESEQNALLGVSLRSRLFAPLADVVAFLHSDDANDEEFIDLLFGLIGLAWTDADWFTANRDRIRATFPESFPDVLPPEFAAVRLTAQEVKLVADRGKWRMAEREESPTLTLKPDLRVHHRLARGSGREQAVTEAVEFAGRRLHADQLSNLFGPRRKLRSTLRTDPSRLAAACLFPLSRASLARLVNTIVDSRSIPEELSSEN